MCLLHLRRSLSQGQSGRGILTILAPRQVQSTKCLGVISNTTPIYLSTSLKGNGKQTLQETKVTHE